MENFEFFNPVRIIFGAGELKRIGEEASQIGKSALVVSYKETGPLLPVLSKIRESLESAGVRVVEFLEATPNPTVEEAEAGIAVAKKEKLELIIGVGGGSSMDLAKIIAAGVTYKHNIWNMIMSRHDEVVAVPPEEALPTIMVPTLPATSSEMNAGAIITNTETTEKSYVFAGCLYPRLSILDPELTLTLPPYQTACGAADAISHVMELYLNGADDTPVQDYIMEGVIRTTVEQVRIALDQPDNLTARTHLQWAACVAWNGWTQPGTASGVPMHMIGHVLSARYNITHGATLSIIMPAFMKYLYKHRVDRYLRFGVKIFDYLCDGEKKERCAEEVIERFESFLNEIGVETRLSQAEVPKAEIKNITDDVVRTAFSSDGVLGARPPLKREDVERILEIAY